MLLDLVLEYRVTKLKKQLIEVEWKNQNEHKGSGIKVVCWCFAEMKV